MPAAYILVVDDDRGVCDVIELLLADEGYEVMCAQNGLAALRLLRDRAPDLIVLDLLMPELNGEDFAVACRQSAGSLAPIVAISTLPDGRGIASRIGAVGFLGKPFDIVELLDVVRSALSHLAPVNTVLALTPA